MGDVRRVYVEKRKGYDIEAQGVLADLKSNLSQNGLTSLRILNRYDIQGLDGSDYEKVRNQILSEPMVDVVYDELLTSEIGEQYIPVEYLPGQYDQRADWAAQCITLLTGCETIVVRTAKVYALQGQCDLDRIQQYLINPVECRLAAMDKPVTLNEEFDTPEDIATLDGFIHLDKKALAQMAADMGMAMTVADLAHVQTYFANVEKRDPSMTEIRVIDTYWSDHCRHTTFLTTLDQVTFDKTDIGRCIEQSFLDYLADRQSLGRKNAPCLMDMALTGPRVIKARGGLKDLDESEEINACSIVVPVEFEGKTQDWLVMFKNETHNHPTEIEPFGGAATCLGGAIRDPLSGRSYVYQAMRITGSGDPTAPISDTLPHKLPQRKITTGAAHGYSSYGNQIGLATGQVTEIYHKGYMAKRMELGAVIAAAPKENVVRDIPSTGDVIILLGGRTGRDGCGGATGSSKAHTTDSLAQCGAEVQKGNPVTERKIQRLFRDPQITKKIKRCNDFGAGGVSVAIGELADGLSINLDAVPRKYEGLDGTELSISESQERMAVVVAPEDVQALINGAAAENLEATPVAIVTDNGRLTMQWRGKTIVDLSREFLNTNGAEQHTTAHVAAPDPEAYPYHGDDSHEGKEAWVNAITQLNSCSQQGLSGRFDSTIGAGTILLPYAGKYQKTPVQAMAAKIPAPGAKTATLMAHGFDPVLSSWSPYHGAMTAVVESLARIVAAGGDYTRCHLTFQEYFERLRDEPTRWGKPVAALLGALEAQKQLGIASIGGKDSMSGSFMDLDVPPTLVSIAVGTAPVDNIRSGELKKPGNRLYYLPARYDSNNLPDWDYIKGLFTQIHKAMSSGKIVSAYTVGIGGIAAAVTKMAFGNQLGAQLDTMPSDARFQPRYGSFVIETDESLILPGVDSWELGAVLDEPIIRAACCDLNLAELLALYERPLNDVFPIYANDEAEKVSTAPSKACTIKTSAKIARPKVFIPTFPGTNCELDTAQAFIRAGAEPNILLLCNQNTAAIEQSVLEMEKSIRQSQIIAIPGGFSAGDEPEGSAKFIVATFSHPRIRDAVMDLLQNRDGLMLGICNGFQALVKLGLAPYGQYRDMSADAPTLTFNTIGRHVSCMAQTRVASKLSPWYSLCEEGDIHTLAFSHGEGRFVAPGETMDALLANGQICTQYVDFDGSPTMDPRYNPNGSMHAIEGICSPDGRVLGKMGHSERSGYGVAVNIPGNKDDQIFRSGVAYFG